MSDTCSACGAKLSKLKAAKTLQYYPYAMTVCDECHEKGTFILGGVPNPDDAFAVHSMNTAMSHFRNILKKNRYEQSMQPFIEALAGITDEDRRREAEAEESRRRYFEERDSILITTGTGFANHRLVEYRGVFSGTCIVGTGFMTEMKASVSDMFGTASSSMESKMDEASKSALEKVVKQAMFAGGNAVLGVSYNVYVLDGNMLGVTASGTSVVIEPLS